MPIQSNERITEAITIAANGIHAVSESAGTYLTSAVDMKKFRKVLFLFDIGSMSSSSTVTCSLQAATTSGGSYTAVTGFSATQLTQAGGNGNQYVEIGISAPELQSVMGYGYEFVKAQVVVGTAATVLGVHCIGAMGPWEPTNINADASLVQAVELP